MFNVTEPIFRIKKCKSIEKCPKQEWAFPFHKESVWKKIIELLELDSKFILSLLEGKVISYETIKHWLQVWSKAQ